MVETESQIVIELPIEKEFARLLRLMVSGIATRMDFNLDAVEDLKIAVEEGFLTAMRRRVQNPLRIGFSMLADRLEISFSGAGGNGPPMEEPKDDFGSFILDAVVDETSIDDSGDKFSLRLIKYS